MDDKSKEFEQAAARILYANSEKIGLTQAEMGNLAFAGETALDRKIRLLFKAERPRALKISELYSWAKGIGVDPARVISRAMDIVENNEPMPSINVTDRPGCKPGSRKKPKKAPCSKRAA